MTPTGELRARLDERGINWWPDKYYRDTNTCWRVGDFEWRASEQKDGKLLIGCTCVKYLTPEQAIAATVGGKDVSALRAKVKAQSDYIDKLRGEYKALDEQMERRCAEYRYTIRNLKAELDAATVGAGTCHIIEDEDTGYLTCSECGAIQPDDYTVYHCWCCGKKIKED